MCVCVCVYVVRFASQAYCVSVIAHWDWPEAWPNLLPRLDASLGSGNASLVHGAMRVLIGIIKLIIITSYVCHSLLLLCCRVLQRYLRYASAVCCPSDSTPASESVGPASGFSVCLPAHHISLSLPTLCRCME